MTSYKNFDARGKNRLTESVTPEDAQVEMALRNFRESIRGWSEQEYARPRVLQPGRHGVTWWVARHVGIAWALAAVLAVTATSVPVSVHLHHEHVVMEAKKAADRVADQAAQDRLAEVRLQSSTMDDEELLKHVDSDIAQDTPDAMEPLASLMGDSVGH